MKINDVYRLKINHEKYPDFSNHCFEGLLVVKKGWDGKIFLADTFWGIGNTTGKTFTFKEAIELGALFFVCNLNDVIPIGTHETVYFDNSDIIVLYDQHGCMESCVHRFLRTKDIKRSKKKMLSVIDEKIGELKKEIKYAIDDIEKYAEKRIEIEKGNFEISL
jgi:hypothetical protein